jgi:hypothetical protein
MASPNFAITRMDYDSATGWWVRLYRPGENKMDISGGFTGKHDLW